jgi:hypothetical protein
VTSGVSASSKPANVESSFGMTVMAISWLTGNEVTSLYGSGLAAGILCGQHPALSKS